MRSFGLYFLAGLLAGVLLNFVVPIAAADLVLHAWPAAHRDNGGLAPVQAVNRSPKSDRLKATPLRANQNTPQHSPVLNGCDGAFSSLSETAVKLNYSSRCVA